MDVFLYIDKYFYNFIGVSIYFYIAFFILVVLSFISGTFNTVLDFRFCPPNNDFIDDLLESLENIISIKSIH